MNPYVAFLLYLAAILGFVHPITGKQLRFERDPPADMADLIDALRAMPT